MPRRPIRWTFDELPPSGARRGGDPSEHAFEHDLGTFVREVVQNANDQAKTWPSVRFHLIELTGDELRAFQDALAWETLEPHLRGASDTKGGRGVGELLDEIERSKRLLLLDVEDRGTIGLVGDESEGDSHFRALCKDTLYSHKQSDSAGGSYGLGKSVLWSFSGLSTVLFNSKLLEGKDADRSPRLIGRCELPSHATSGGQWYTGSGWVGETVQMEHGARAESVWSDRAAELAKALRVNRADPDAHGTSILIVGFRDPTSETEDDPDELALRIRQATTRYFWPAMVMYMRKLRIAVVREGDDEHVQVDREPAVAPFVECYRRRAEAGHALHEPGDLAVRRIPIHLPDRRDGTRLGTGYVDLVVRLASEGDRTELRDHVAMFRGPGMVVRYWDRSGLTIGMRPFHAILVCGEARDPANVEEIDHQVDRFLRDAEPPGHDKWDSTPTLKREYKRGYGKALKQLESKVNEELRKLLAPQPIQGTKGPDRLQKRFPIGPRGGRGSEPSAFHFSNLSARYDGERWHFHGEMQPNRFGLPWQATLSLNELGEDGRPVDAVAIATLSIEVEGASHRLADGTAAIDAGPDVRAVSFSGTSEPVVGAAAGPGELGFEITGRLGQAESAG